MRGFSWQLDYDQFVGLRPPVRLSRIAPGRICLPETPTTLDRLSQQAAGLHSCVTPHSQTTVYRYGIIQPVFHRLRRLASA
jgi:hypothetical protein